MKCDKDKVIRDFSECRSYTETAKLNNISRQRVEQIIKRNAPHLKPKQAHFAWVGKKCSICGRLLGVEVKSGSRLMCQSCVSYSRAKRVRKHKFRNFEYPSNCIECGVEFSVKVNRQSGGLCERCYVKTPDRVAKRKQYLKAYYQRDYVKEKTRTKNRQYYLERKNKVVSFLKDKINSLEVGTR